MLVLILVLCIVSAAAINEVRPFLSFFLFFFFPFSFFKAGGVSEFVAESFPNAEAKASSTNAPRRKVPIFSLDMQHLLPLETSSQAKVFSVVAPSQELITALAMCYNTNLGSSNRTFEEAKQRCETGLISSFCKFHTGVCLQSVSYVFGFFRSRADTSISEAEQEKGFRMSMKLAGPGRGIFPTYAAAMPFAESGSPELFAMTAFDILAVLASVILFVLALKSTFWAEKKSFVVLLVILGLGCAIGACYWTFMGTGYNLQGRSSAVPNIPKLAVDICERMMQVLFLMVVAAFVWVLINAVLETFYPERTLQPKVYFVAFVAITLGVVTYSVTVAVIQAIPNGTVVLPVVDASAAVLPGISFLFFIFLAVMWLLAWRLVRAKKSADAGSAAMLRNAVIFFGGSLMLATVFMAECIVAVLYLTDEYQKYQTALLVLKSLSHALTVVAVLSYIGTAVISATRGQKKHDDNNKGYVPLAEDATEVPEAYQVY